MHIVLAALASTYAFGAAAHVFYLGRTYAHRMFNECDCTDRDRAVKPTFGEVWDEVNRFAVWGVLTMRVLTWPFGVVTDLAKSIRFGKLVVCPRCEQVTDVRERQPRQA